MPGSRVCCRTGRFAAVTNFCTHCIKRSSTNGYRRCGGCACITEWETAKSGCTVDAHMRLQQNWLCTLSEEEPALELYSIGSKPGTMRCANMDIRKRSPTLRRG